MPAPNDPLNLISAPPFFRHGRKGRAEHRHQSQSHQLDRAIHFVVSSRCRADGKNHSTSAAQRGDVDSNQCGCDPMPMKIVARNANT